ncbi:MAG TPA: cytochrome c biogenesis protein CcdA [Candidatus Aminicenantes bacterium]|nr:cytochrome c biogenesis protein CcdA [Candidatus Aminicenantes bacterium]HNT31277.1 cytochrome c biogenesis protein CcdA [Candidatus Aminicenantes bacterium]HOF83025.1 cytochrome c biogenesis protein CcdA [Candidatus Aminicenantes bacterium]HOS11439.1 cytochrome c biogenesis protein CcdA [Candidatus Aminicenantes bacterium]HOU48291.1 cytochrome c biogenesis protein CcdA [Candidatus Aminicenantes bacterium]
MNALFGDIGLILQNNPWLAIPAVFLGGVMTASNPCVLAMIPLMIGLVAGRSESGGLKRTFLFSLFFVLGLAATFTALGLVSALLGRMFGDVGRFWKPALAVVCLVMGANLLGLFHFNFSFPGIARFKGRGLLGSLALGLLFGLVSTPCAVPVLAVLLAFAAEKGNVLFGGVLLFIYALGHSVLILIAGTSMGAARRMIESKGLKKASRGLQKAAGVIIILVGTYLLVG